MSWAISRPFNRIVGDVSRAYSFASAGVCATISRYLRSISNASAIGVRRFTALLNRSPVGTQRRQTFRSITNRSTFSTFGNVCASLVLLERDSFSRSCAEHPVRDELDWDSLDASQQFSDGVQQHAEFSGLAICPYMSSADRTEPLAKPFFKSDGRHVLPGLVS